MGFQAKLENTSVVMSWNDFEIPSNHSFVYWKVMRSQKTDNPVYRESNSEYVTYNGNIWFTSYTDTAPTGTSRYRICAITKASDGYHRYCSKEIEKIIRNYENTTTQPSSPAVTTTLTNAQITVLDEIANQFLTRLQAKYSEVAKRNEVISNVIIQLETLAKRRTSMKPMISYLNTKLEVAIDPLEEIKSILNVE